MIVDDHAGARQMIREMLNFPGVTFCECASGEEALEKACEFQPDWITIDFHMPGLNGFQTATSFQSKYPDTRVVIVTSDNHPYLQQLARVVGAKAHICKENLAELREIIANAIARKEVNCYDC